MLKKVLGEKSKHCHQPLKKSSAADDERPPYVKLKIQTSFPSGEIVTGAVVQNKSGDITHVDVKTIDDVLNHVPFQARVRCLITVSKLWYQPASLPDACYGLVFKIVKLCSKPPDKFTNHCFGRL